MMSEVVSKCASRGLMFALAVAVALPEELPAAPLVNLTGMQPTFALSDSLTEEMLRVHCCHAHPLPPYDGYCCHGGAVVVGGYGGYYGAAGVRGTARRTSRRTSRRVSRRR